MRERASAVRIPYIRMTLRQALEDQTSTLATPGTAGEAL
jgi:hypothetical protein